MKTPEFSSWFGEELRTLLAYCQGTLWGVHLGLWAHLVEKIPLRTGHSGAGEACQCGIPQW